MKVLIWFLTFFLGSILNGLLGYATGIYAGAVLLYIVEYYIGKRLCEKWDMHKQKKAESKMVAHPAQVVSGTDERFASLLQDSTVEKRLSELKVESGTVHLCRKCGAELAEDAKFCRKCGTKVDSSEKIEESVSPAAIEKTTQRSMGVAGYPTKNPNSIEPTYKQDSDAQRLSEIVLNEIDGNFLVLVEKASLYHALSSDEYYLRCSFRSLTDNKICALLADIICYDIWGTEISQIYDVQFLDFAAGRDERFGEEKKIKINDSNTRIVGVELKKLRLQDGTIIACSGQKYCIPDTQKLLEQLGSENLVQQYMRETAFSSVFVPVQESSFWRCACGEINFNSESVCYQCKLEKQQVFNWLDKEKLTQSYAAYAEQKRMKEEQRRREKLQREREIALQEELTARSQYMEPTKTSSHSSDRSSWLRYLFLITVIAAICLLLVFLPSLLPTESPSASYQPYVVTPPTTQKPTETEPTTPKPTETEPTTPKPTEPKPQARPESGSVALNTAGGEKTVAEIIVHAANKNCVVRLKSTSGKTVISFFVRANETATVWVPPRTLYAYFAEGDTWYGWKYLFGDDATYSKDPTPTDFSNCSIEYTLYTVPNGNLTLTTIDEDDF